MRLQICSKLTRDNCYLLFASTLFLECTLKFAFIKSQHSSSSQINMQCLNPLCRQLNLKLIYYYSDRFIFVGKHINLLMIAQKSPKLSPQSNHRLRMPAPREVSPHRFNQLLGKIQNTKRTFRNLMSNYVHKEHLLPQSQSPNGQAHSGYISTGDIKDDNQKIDNSAEAETQNNPSSMASRVICEINQREIKTSRRFVRSDPKQSKTSINDPANCYKKNAEHKEDKLPSPKQKSMLVLDKSLKLREKQHNSPPQINKSNLDFNAKHYKKVQNGAFVRLQTPEMIRSRIKQAIPKSNQVIILNPNLAPASVASDVLKILPNKSDGLYSVDFKIVKKYVKQMGLLDDQASANMVFQYFNKLASHLRISFQSPLIKKYKNCVFFGQNPQKKSSYEGLLYHYKSKLYFGQFREGKKHGRGCQMNFKEGLVCWGQYLAGVKAGYFKVKANDYEYQGDIRDGLFDGEGVLRSKYSKYFGSFMKGYKHGYGEEQFFLSGQQYIGNYNSGKFNGNGQIVSKNYYYEGQFRQNLKYGQGYEKTTIDEYKGDFVQGKRQGQGFLNLQNGDSYRGEFKNGHMYGKGEYQYSDGQHIQGYFVNGRMISERDISKHRTKSKRKVNLFQIQESKAEELQTFGNTPTRKKTTKKSNIFAFSPDQILENQSVQRQNPQKYERLIKKDEHPQYSTPQPKQDKAQVLMRRASDLDRPESLQNGLDSHQYHSVQKRRKDPEGYNPTRPSTNFMQLDYSLFDKSVDEDVASLPQLSTYRPRN